MSDFSIILEHCQAEVIARHRWAENVTDEWRQRASLMSLQMAEDAVTKPLDLQAEEMLEQWRRHGQPDANNRVLDPIALRQWDAVLAGDPIDGNYSYFQRRYPEPAVLVPA